MIVVVDNWRPLVRNTLRGFATVQLPEGLVLHDVAVHIRDGKTWALPSGRPMIGRDGAVLKDAAGKAQYTPTLTFVGRGDQEAFSAAIVDAVRASYPEAMR